jgi:hypothetical protein
MAFGAETRMRSSARGMARNTNVPFKGWIQQRKAHDLQIITFGLQRAAGPYRRATSGPMHRSKARPIRSPHRPAPAVRMPQ